MAIIAQKRLFDWHEIEESGDLKRLQLVLEHLPDEKLMRSLERRRGHGRNDYPIRAVWNSILAGVVYQHPSIESLRRELSRNGQLRWLCGFTGAVPPASVYSRFVRRLLARRAQVEKMFRRLVDDVEKELPDLGQTVSLDGKALGSYARGRRGQNPESPERDGRKEQDATWGKHVYKGKRADGSPWRKVVSWFGFTLHLAVDAQYELPIAYRVTPAATAEVVEGHHLVQHLEKEHPALLERSQYWVADRGYDDKKLHKRLWDEHGIKPVIDIRTMWKEGEETRVLTGHSHVVYDYCGTVSCHCPQSDIVRAMAYGGFEKRRQSLKYRCPAGQYGLVCEGKESCPVKGAIRIPLEENRRIFTPLARSSYQWKRVYRKRTAVERVNSRLDTSFGFENHTIRGWEKMQLRVGLALCVMLTMALGRIREKTPKRMRSLVA